MAPVTFGTFKPQAKGEIFKPAPGDQQACYAAGDIVHSNSSLHKGSISFRFWVLYHSTDLDEPYKPVTSVFLISEN